MHPNPNMQAVRALRRALSGTKEQQLIDAEGEWADRQFDGGEFSGPAQAREEEARFDRIVSVVAKRFGITRYTLLCELEDAGDEEHCRLLQAFRDRNNKAIAALAR